jgi:zinc protease
MMMNERSPLAGLFLFLAVVLLSLPARAVEIQRVVSPGGVEAWLVEDHTVPLIALNFSVNGGAAQDPEGQEGLTRLLSATLDEGAGDLDSEAFQGRLEELAVSISFSVGKDQFYGTMRTLTATRGEAFDLLRLAVNDPRFDDEAVGRMKAKLVSSARRNAQDPNAIASLQLMKSLLGDHPYARPAGGTEDSLSGLTPDDLRSQYGKLFARSGLKVAVVGAIDADTLAPLLDAVFGELPEAGSLTPVPDVAASAGQEVSASLSVPQTTMMFGLAGLKRKDSDYQAAFVMNHILGGGSFTSWLYEEVREKRGLTYGISTFLLPYNRTGLLLGSVATRADRADETLKVIREQIARMANEGPTQDELDSAKRYLTGSYALRFDSSGKIANQLVALQNAGLGIDYFDRRNAEIEAVTLDDVKRVAKRLLAQENPTISSVGPVGN